MTSERIPGGGGPAGVAVDTSWLHETSDPSGDGRSRGRGGRRRARRCTLSPSIGSKSFMSGVDFDDPENFPNIPLSSAVPVSGGSGSGSVGIITAEDGNAGLVISPTQHTLSPSPGSDPEASRLPDPSVVANLFDEEGTTPEPKLSPPLGLLGSLRNQNQACSMATERDRSGKKGQGQGQGQGSAKSVKSSNRDAHTTVGVENRQPGLDRPGVVAEGDATAAAVTSSPPSVLMGATSRASSSTTVTKARPATTTIVTPGGGKGETKGVLPSPAAASAPASPAPEPAAAPPPVAAKQKKSRNSRRRSILMPSEAQSFVESDLGGNGVEVAQPRQNFPGADTGAPSPTAAAAAAAAAAATTDREGKPTRTSGRNGGGGGSGRGGGRNGGKSAAKEFPLASINAMSCLSRPLATQRGWSPANGDTTKSLVRAYYAAGKGSQRARRIAARLFCLTGFCLLPVTPDDARVLCEAAGDSLEWGLEETEKPRLVTRPPVRETREQKRALLLRIKPLFELMENATQEEKRAAEAKTGVVSRKAAPDGYCYEDRETKSPVDPDVYKAMYTKHIHASREARLREFALLRANVSSPPEAVAGSISDSEKKEASAASVTVPDSPAEEARAPENAAAALTAQPLPVETERIEAARVLETAKTGKGPEDAVDSAEESQAAGRLASAVPGAPDQGTHSGNEAESTAAGKAIPVREVGADGVGTPRAVTPSRVSAGDEGTADWKTCAPPAVVGGAGDGANRTEADEEVKTPVGVPSPGKGERTAAIAEGMERCHRVGGDPLVVTSGAIGVAEGSLSSVASGSSLDSPNIDSDVTARAQPAPAPLELEQSGIVAVEANVSRVPSVEEDGPQPDPEGSSCSGGDLAIRTSPPSLPFVGELTVSPPKTAVVPKNTSPERTEAEMLSGEDCGGDAAPSEDGQTQEVSAVGADDAQAAASPLVPSRDNSNTPPRVFVGGDDKGRNVGEGPWTPLNLSPLAFPARSEEDDREAPSRQAAGHGGTVQMLPSVQHSSAPLDASNVRDMEASSEDVLGSVEAAEEAEELAALEKRLWSGWDALLAEYHAVAALIKSRRSRHVVAAVTTVSSHENPTVFSPIHAAVPPVTTPNATPTGAMLAARSVSGGEQDAPSSRVSVTSSPANGTANGARAFLHGGGGSTSSSSPPAPVPPQQPLPTGRADDIGVRSPSSPLLPLLDLHLSEEEELLESRSFRGAVEGTRAPRATSRSTRRRSPMQHFSAEKRDRALKQRQQQRQQQGQQREGGAMGSAGAEAAAEESVVREAREVGEEGGTCKLCCRKESDRILRPCQHVACGTCVEKLRVQAEQSGEALSCPWDRQPVDEIDVYPLL